VELREDVDLGIADCLERRQGAFEEQNFDDVAVAELRDSDRGPDPGARLVGPERSFREERIEQVNVDVFGPDSLHRQGIGYEERDIRQQPMQQKGLLMLDRGIDLELGRLGTAHRGKSLLVVAEAAQDVLDMARVSGTEIEVGTHQAAVDGEMADDATVAATEGDEDGQHAKDIPVA
jgi:hypothetical protein